MCLLGRFEGSPESFLEDLLDPGGPLSEARRGAVGAGRCAVLSGSSSSPSPAPSSRTRCRSPPPPSLRTDWTRLVPPPVLTGHVSSSRTRCAHPAAAAARDRFVKRASAPRS